MPQPPAVLHMLCGKIASGKSTLAAQLAAAPATVLISEDDWLAALFGAQMQSPADYLTCAEKLQGVMGPHVVSLLREGLSVVLDFPANTPAQRAWMRGIVETAGVVHEMHVIEAPDALCLQRLKARNAQGDHPFAATEEQFHRFTKHYRPPAADEGFLLVAHTAMP
ncbi:AAA family ATPase [Pseudoruegeria sp. SHC-113]|uniref:AAA family ATPase n=1 Tax=Pseudoruegeria sp. SHC-113 TaxID=2855439 RepID=UPI0021BAAB51|nr:ATP-binding protein [Pseudoruegeria sp. SHC-113]